MKILSIKNLTKEYPAFLLNNVSFELEEGYIMGFIGSNGAGKTTTLKTMLNLVQAKEGDVKFFGLDYKENEREIKQRLGFMFGDMEFYIKRKIKDITDVVKRFYANWNEEVYIQLIEKFNLDENKRLEELSRGMRVKYSLTLALSHDAQLLILDEPTSGLDPVARDELLELFQELVEDGKRSVLFSTHITSDLDKCADYITYIDNGRIIESTTKDDLLDSHRLISFDESQLNNLKEDLIAYKKNSFGYFGLMKTDKANCYSDIKIAAPSIDDIMIYYSRGEKHEKSSL
ncbi:MAG: ABC transporter ATP-binding protein [Candidatus Izemoplasmatales bacterium]